MIKQVCFTAVLMFGFHLLMAQPFTLEGRVQTDARQALHGASVQLQSFTQTTTLQTVLTDSTGSYRFSIFTKGKYLLIAIYTGYGAQVSDTISLRNETPVVQYNFTLQPSDRQLAGVTVNASKAVVQVENGKMVFNLQNQAVTAGQTAFDILKKLPGVGIDQNENILFRGTAGINVLVDGKMTYLSGLSLTNFLKGLPAEDISKIELVATPGADLDAAGGAGIIQIITKRKKIPGYAVDVQSAVSRAKYWMTNQNVTASLRMKQFAFYGSLDYNTPNRYYDKVSGNTLPGSGGNLSLQRTQQTIFKVKYYTWRAGIDWQLHPRHNLSLRYHGYFDDFKGGHYSLVNTVQQSVSNITSFIRSANSIIEPYHYDAPSLSYRFDIDSLGKKITADANYTSYRNYSDGLLTTQNFTAAGSPSGENKLQVHQPGFIKIKSVKTDASLPFKHIALTTGLKWAEVQNDNRYQYDSLLNGQYIAAETMSNHFLYKEQVAAAYVSGDKRWKNTAINAGLRLERTDARGYTVKGDAENRWNYTQLFPSASITQQLDDEHEISISASRRINRPSYADLNPVRWYSDQYFYYSGNPGLVPELAWVYAFTYSLQKKYVLAATYNRSTNYMNRLLTVEGTTIKSQSVNLGTLHRLDLTASLPLNPLPFWSVQAFTDMSYTRYPISIKNGLKQLRQWANATTLQQSFTLPHKWEATLNGNYYSSELRGIYLTCPAWFIDAGVKKTFLQNRLTAQFNCNDIFHTNRYAAFSQTDITNYFYNDRPNSQQLSLSFTYHIGGNMVKSGNRKIEEQERL